MTGRWHISGLRYVPNTPTLNLRKWMLPYCIPLRTSRNGLISGLPVLPPHVLVFFWFGTHTAYRWHVSRCCGAVWKSGPTRIEYGFTPRSPTDFSRRFCPDVWSRFWIPYVCPKSVSQVHRLRIGNVAGRIQWRRKWNYAKPSKKRYADCRVDRWSVQQ